MVRNMTVSRPFSGGNTESKHIQNVIIDPLLDRKNVCAKLKKPWKVKWDRLSFRPCLPSQSSSNCQLCPTPAWYKHVISIWTHCLTNDIWFMPPIKKHSHCLDSARIVIKSQYAISWAVLVDLVQPTSREATSVRLRSNDHLQMWWICCFLMDSDWW